MKNRSFFFFFFRFNSRYRHFSPLNFLLRTFGRKRSPHSHSRQLVFSTLLFFLLSRRRWLLRCRGPCRAGAWATEAVRARRGERHLRRRRERRRKQQQHLGMSGTPPLFPRPLAASGETAARRLLLSGSCALALQTPQLQLGGRARRPRRARATTSSGSARRWSISRRPSTTRFWPNSAWPREGGGECFFFFWRWSRRGSGMEMPSRVLGWRREQRNGANPLRPCGVDGGNEEKTSNAVAKNKQTTSQFLAAVS